MTFLAPGFFFAALAAAAAVVVAHLIAWRQPPDLVLPTVRFVPDESARRSARAIRLADIGLLLLRAAIVLLAGAALAHPVIVPARSGTMRLIAADVSSAVGDPRDVRDSVGALQRDGASVIIAFDTTARPARGGELAPAAGTPAPGALSPLLVALRREARRLALRHERVELAIVSPFLEGEFDAATRPLRLLIADPIRLVRVRGVAETTSPAGVAIRAASDDPVAAGIRLALSSGLARPRAPVRVVRGPLTGEDSAWVAGGDRVLLWWPADPAMEPASTDPGERASPVVRGVTTGEATLLGYLRPASAPGGAAVARWLDGTAAAAQTTLGEGCLRHVAFDVPVAGDLTLTTSFQRFAGELIGPCTPGAGAPVSDSTLAQFASAPAGDERSTAQISALAVGPNRPGALLLLLAIGAGVVEMVVRRRRPSAPNVAASIPEGGR